MEVRRFFNAILRMSWIIVILAVIGGGISAYTNLFLSTDMFSAETTVYALSRGENTSGKESINYQDVMLSKQLVQDYQEIIYSEKVCTLAASKLIKYNITTETLKSMVFVNPKNDSSIIGIMAISNDPQLAADASIAVTDAFVTRLHELTNNNIVGILDAAKVPPYPMPNDSTKKIIIGVAAGIVIALTLIYVREYYDSKLRYIDEVEKYTKSKVIGVIPKFRIN